MLKEKIIFWKGRINIMKSKQRKLFSVLSAIFYLFTFLSPFVSKVIIKALGYGGDSVPITVIVMAVCAVILGTVAAINKEHIAIGVSIVTCVAITVYMLILEDEMSVEWLLSGYLYLFLSALALILGKMTGKQKVFRIVQIVIVVFLVANVALSINAAINGFYGLFGINWDRVYIRIAMTTNSVASVFLGMWAVSCSKCSDK